MAATEDYLFSAPHDASILHMIGPAGQVFLSNELQDIKHLGESLNTDGSRRYEFVQGLHLKMLYHRRPDW